MEELVQLEAYACMPRSHGHVDSLILWAIEEINTLREKVKVNVSQPEPEPVALGVIVNPQRPSLGRIVLYNSSAFDEDGQPLEVETCVAIIVKVHDDGSGQVNLQVFLDRRARRCHWAGHVAYDQSGKAPKTWRWPPRVS